MMPAPVTGAQRGGTASAGLPGKRRRYVLPGEVGYLGPMSALTPYSPPGSGLPGAGNLPPGGWSWQSYGMRNDNTNVALDHVLVYGGIQVGGLNITVTNSVIYGGLSWFAFYNANLTNPAGGRLNFSDSTLGWDTADFGVYPPGFDVAAVHDATGNTAYNIIRCDLSGFPQGLNPGVNSLLLDSYFHGLVQNSTDPLNPTHLDGIFNEGSSNVTIRGCYIDAGVWATDPPSGCLFFQNPGGPDTIPGCVVAGNFLHGGGYTFYNQAATGIIVTNNVFGGGFNFGDAVNIDTGTIGTWSGNVRLDGSVVPSP